MSSCPPLPESLEKEAVQLAVEADGARGASCGLNGDGLVSPHPVRVRTPLFHSCTESITGPPVELVPAQHVRCSTMGRT